MKCNYILYLTFSLLLLITSCVPMEKLSYLNDISTGNLSDTLNNPLRTRTIKLYDKIYIQILSIDEQTANVFNAGSQNHMIESMINLTSYQVDKSGNIDFPYVGKIHLAELTIAEAKTKIKSALNQYVSNTEVNVSFVNNKITILGEVRHPGTVFFYDDKVTIFEALAGAGGFADFGRRDNLTIVRNEDDEVIYHTVDISKKSVLQNDLYYVQAGDILIVHPIETKYRRLRDYGLANTLLTSITTSVTVITLILATNNNSN